MSKDIKNKNNDLDEFEFDFEEDSKDEELDDFDFDDDNEDDSKSEKDDDFDFDDDKEEENSNDDKEEDNDSIEVENEEKEITATEDVSEDVEDDFDFNIDDDDDSTIEDEEELKKEKEKEVSKEQEKLKEEAFEDDDDLDIDDIFSSDEELEDEDDEDYVDSFINDEGKEEDLEEIEDEEEIDNQAMQVTQDLDIEDEEVKVVKAKPEVKDVLQNKKKSSFSLKNLVIGMFGVVIVGGTAGAGYIFKDNIMDLISGNSLEREGDSIYSVEFEKKTQLIAEKIVAGKLLELNSTIEKYETKLSELELNQATLMSKNRILETSKEEQQSIINTIQKNDNKDSQSMIELEERLNQFMIEIDSVKSEQVDNKDLLKKTVEATLNLIKENKMLDKNLENKVYDKVYNEFKKIFDSQRFRLNDLSIIEGKLNEALSFNKKILQDLKQTKIDNQKLIEDQRDLNRKVIKLERAVEEKETAPLVNNNSKSQRDNNVINLLKQKTPENAIIIDKKADNAATIPKYHLQGIIGGNVAYLKIKGQENARARAYSAGDTLEGYGKILSIETSYIVTEKGELRRERK